MQRTDLPQARSRPGATGRVAPGRWRDSWSATLAGGLGILLVIACLVMLAADVSRQSPQSFLYALADNLFVACAVLALLLALVAPAQRAVGVGGEGSTGRQLAVSVGVGAAVAAVALALVAVAGRAVGLHSVTLSVALGVGIGLVVLSLLRPLAAAGWREPVGIRYAAWLYGALAALVLVGAVLRWLWPGDDLLTWVIVPVDFLLVPGLSLGLVLLPRSASWPERLLYAVPLSLSFHVVSLMWFDLLGIPVTMPLFYLLAGAVALAGLGWELLRYRARRF